jgi:trk system potassium uptake protein TrkH
MARSTLHSVRAADATASRWEWLRALLALAAVIPVLLEHGWLHRLLPLNLAESLVFATLACYCAATVRQAIVRSRGGGSLRRELRRHRSMLVLAGAGAVLAWWTPAMFVAPTLLLLVHALFAFLALVSTRIPPGLVFVGSFIGLIAVGASLLMLPAATPRDQPIDLMDAVFTITSAISQTGLVVRDTGAGFTRFGQIVILAWIQIGALGVIVFGALLATVIGSHFSLRATQSMVEPTEQGWSGALSLRKLVVFIIVVTHAFEIAGATVIYLAWPETWDGAPDIASTGDRIFHSVFFSVSAFCNAGFVTTANSLQGLRAHWSSHLVIAPLIILGSIGFPVLDNIWRVGWARLRRQRIHRGALIRFNLNTKIVLTTTLVVYVLGYGCIFLGELTQTDEPSTLVMLDAHFMTVNRTSGFDTIPPAEMGMLSLLTLLLLMFIGGSPGSVAGGIKMMVFAVLALTVWSTINGRSETQVFGRTLPDALVRKSATLIVLSLAAVMAATGVLAASNTGNGQFSFGELLFEATSAFGTTGLSLGVTPETSTPGRIALTGAMFVGRVGPLAVMAALVGVTLRRRPRYAYPTEDVVIY